MGKKVRQPNIPSSVKNPMRQAMDNAQALDQRRQHQISNQIAAINRLAAAMQRGEAWSYTDEMQTLHEQLAAVQEVADRTEKLLRNLLDVLSPDTGLAAEVREALGIETTPAAPAGAEEEE